MHASLRSQRSHYIPLLVLGSHCKTSDARRSHRIPPEQRTEIGEYSCALQKLSSSPIHRALDSLHRNFPRSDDWGHSWLGLRSLPFIIQSVCSSRVSGRDICARCSMGTKHPTWSFQCSFLFLPCRSQEHQ